MSQKHEYTMANSPVTTSKSAHLSAVPKLRDGCPTTVVQLFDGRQPKAVANVAGALEAMPHLVERICLLWNQGEFEPYVNRLILDSRDGARQGLPWEAAQELMFLSELSMAKRALHASEVTGVPFRQMFERCLETAERTGQSGSTTGLSLEPKADPWGDPRANSNSDTSRREKRPESAPRTPPKKKSWF
jgi:hypothetical protein